jgi:iron complex transport system substrate-binding protein
MLFALGLGGDVVGVTHECDFPAAAAGLPHLTRTVLPSGLSAGEIDAAVKEVVGEGRALYSLDEELLAELAAAGIQLEAGGIRRELEDRLEAVRAAVSAEPRPRVLALEWLDPPFLGGHWVPEMIDLASGEDVIGRPGEKSPQVAWKDLDGLDPGVVIAMPCGWYLDDSRAQALEHRERLDALAAGRIFAVDAASTFSRPGPRLVDGVELLAHLFHPERVRPPAGIEFADLSAQISRS